MVVAIIVGVFVALALILVVGYLAQTAPARLNVKALKATEQNRSTTQEMHLLLTGLVRDQERGLNVAFIDESELRRAQRVCAAYQKELVK